MSGRGADKTMSDAQGYMSPEEAMSVINATRSLRDKAILWLLFSSGCRISELLLLEIKDIDFEQKILYMWTLKRKLKRRYQRLVYVDDSTLDILRQYMRAYNIENGVLFTLTARRIRQIVFESGCRVGLSRVGSKKIHPHHFRHSHAVAWVRNNPTMESLRKLQARLGHSSFNTTVFYLQYSKAEHQAEAESALAEMLAPQ